jgi:adenylate cyclase
MNYTVMGDCVNLSSRLEGLNKQVGTRILVSEATQRAAGEAMVSRLLGAVAVKGKRAEVRVWTPVCPHADATAADLARVARWNAAVEQYMAGDFAGALPAFEAYLAEAPDDEPARQKVDACRRFIALPPEDTWDGALVAGVKS